MKRHALVAVAAVLVTLLALVVVPAQAGKDTLVIGFPTDVPIFDTHKVLGLHNVGIVNQASENLVRLTSKGEIVPWLAESWQQSSDGRTWTIKLRRGVTFTDGTALDPESIIASIERFRRLSIGRAALDMIERMETVDPTTLRITTKAPYAPFINTFGYITISIWSAANLKKVGDDNLHTAPVGSGPFKLAHHKRGQELRLEANDQYWAGKPRLRAVVVRPYPDAGSRVLALESGDVDLIFHVPPQEAARLAKNPNIVVHTPPSARVVWLYLNTQKEPFKDKRVRQALYHAIDREAIVKNIFAGTARALHSPGPVGAVGYTDRYDRYAFNPDRARQLLREAGVGTLAFTVHHAPGRYLLSGQVLEAIQGYLRQVGVSMTITNLEWGALSNMTTLPVERNPMQAIYFGWRSINGDMDSSLQDFGSRFWKPRGNNLSFWKHEEFDRLLDVEQSTLDRTKRLEALHRMQEILMDELPALFLYGEPQIWASRKSLQGVEFGPLEGLLPLHHAHFEE